MCYFPRQIKNPTRSFNPNFDRIRFRVPCQKCGECRKQIQRDWYTRVYAEFHRCKGLGGKVAMITLTYRNENLPIHNGYDCFDRTHIQKFMKKLRTYLTRGVNYVHLDDHGQPIKRADGTFVSEYLSGGYDVKNLRYLICSEYASDPRYTQRPHYHGELFLPFEISQYELDKYIRASWEHGRISFSKKYGAFVSSACGCKYVTKYITKDMTFYKNEELSKRLKNDPDFYADMRPYLPFHLQSKGFGETLVNYLSDEEKLNGRFYLDASDEVEYTIPQYISRKLFYNYNKLDRTWTLSDYGKEIFENRLTNRLNLLKEKYMQYFDWTYLNTILTSAQLHQLNIDMFQDFSELSVNCKNLSDFLKSLMSGRSVDLLVAYSQCYKDVPFLSLQDDIEHFDPKVEYGATQAGYLELSDDMLSRRLHKVTNVLDETSFFKLHPHLYKAYQPYTYNVLPLFEHFDVVLMFLEKIKYFDGLNRQRHFEETEKSRLETKDYHYKNIYG